MTAKEFTVRSVRDIRPPGAPEPVWMVDTSIDGGPIPTHSFGFPHSILTWRVAEYGIDPSDFDTLLDVVLHEPHMTHTHLDPTFLYNTDQDTARAAHLERVRRSKQGVVHHDPDGLLDHIRRAYDPNNPAIEEYKARVAISRREARRG